MSTPVQDDSPRDGGSAASKERSVFLSYSRLDSAKARQFAEAFESEGIMVRWDRDIPGGRDYQDVIEEMLDQASCVVVLWSPNSVKSQWVRSESTAGMERRILLPVVIALTRIPVAFCLVQAEDLTNWDGDRRAESWLRLVLQVKAMHEASSVDIGEQTEAISPPPGGESNPARTIGGVGRWFAALALAIALAVWYWGSHSVSTAFALIIGVAVVVLVLFKTAENDISPRMRSLATQWLLPRAGGARINTAEALNSIFESVFGARHLTAFCFVRSTAISALFLGLLIVLAREILGATVIFTTSVWLSLIFFVGCVNIMGDYVALFCTRIMLRLYMRGLNLFLVLTADFILTAAIFLAAIGLGVIFIDTVAIFGKSPISGGQGGFFSLALHQLHAVMLQPYLDVFDPTSPQLFQVGQRRLLYASAITTFMTTIWLWMALFVTPIFRSLVWAGGTGLTTLGVMFDVHKAPFAALGYLGAVIVILAGSGAWAAGAVVANLAR